MGGILILFLSNIWTWALSLLDISIVPRYIGVVNFGKLSLAGSILSIAGLVVSFGGGTQMVRMISSKENSAPRIFSVIIAFRFALGLPIILAVCIGLFSLTTDKVILSVVVLNAFGMFLGWIGEALMAYRQALSEYTAMARANMSGKLVGVLTRIVLVMHGGGPVGAVIGDLIGSCAGISAAIWSRKNPIRLVRVTRDDFREILREGWPYFRYSLSIWVYGAPTTIYIICAFSTYTANGWYSVAQRLLGLFYLFPGIFMGVMLPMLIRVYERSHGEFKELTRRALNPALVMCLPFMLILTLGADGLIRALGLRHIHSSADFGPVAILLQIAGVNLLIRWASSYYGMLLIASNRVAEQARTAMIAAPFNIVTTIALVIWTERVYHNGAIGACVAGELTEILVVGCYLHSLRGVAPIRENIKAVTRGLMAAVVPALMLLYIPTPNRWAYIAVAGLSVIAFIPAALLVGAIRKDEYENIIYAIKSKSQKPDDPIAPVML